MPNSTLTAEKVVDADGKRIAVIRTSDSSAFKECRRRWDWSSHLRQNLGPIQHANPLWLGAGFHYALEDFHGQNLYGKPGQSFLAFVYAFRQKYPKKVPDDWRELAQLAGDMLDYYQTWLSNRPMLDTYVHNGVPQLEPSIKVPIPMDSLKNWQEIAKHYDEVVYSLTLDRVIKWEGMIWIMEYKTAAQMQTQHFATDPQVSRYVWAADLVYPEKVGGVIYQQHKKTIPNGIRILKNGTISVAQNQATTRPIFRKGLIEHFGDISKVPQAYIDFLTQLSKEETENADAFIRRDFVYRNKHTSEAAAQNILLEASDMLDPNLSIYPNPTRMCPNYCPFFSPCVSKDDGSDWEHQLALDFVPRPAGYDEWRTELPTPEEFKGLKL